MSLLEILGVASEIYPLVKTGGLADVAGALPAALAAEDVRMRMLVPGYPAVMSALETAEEIYNFPRRPRRRSRSLRPRRAAFLRPAGKSL
jgi:starch synthase